MNIVAIYVALSVILTWTMVVTASALKVRPWTAQGRVFGFGNRDSTVPVSSAAGRADRAAKNMLENLLMFVSALAAAKWAGVADDRLLLGVQLFFWSRLAYFLLYVAGIAYVRTLAWAGGVLGLALVLFTVF